MSLKNIYPYFPTPMGYRNDQLEIEFIVYLQSSSSYSRHPVYEEILRAEEYKVLCMYNWCHTAMPFTQI